jgi:hypothetical protein
MSFQTLLKISPATNPPTMEAIRSTGLYDKLIIVFSHPPDNQPARHQPDGSAAPAASWPSVAQL